MHVVFTEPPLASWPQPVDGDEPQWSQPQRQLPAPRTAANDPPTEHAASRRWSQCWAGSGPQKPLTATGLAHSDGRRRTKSCGLPGQSFTSSAVPARGDLRALSRVASQETNVSYPG